MDVNIDINILNIFHYLILIFVKDIFLYVISEIVDGVL